MNGILLHYGNGHVLCTASHAAAAAPSSANVINAISFFYSTVSDSFCAPANKLVASLFIALWLPITSFCSLVDIAVVSAEAAAAAATDNVFEGGLCEGNGGGGGGTVSWCRVTSSIRPNGYMRAKIAYSVISTGILRTNNLRRFNRSAPTMASSWTFLAHCTTSGFRVCTSSFLFLLSE